jgi:hypothetical protein
MALAKRIIPCLDVDNGRVVNGVNFVGIRDAGNPVEVARRYTQQGADEITFLDITATSDDRETLVHVVEQVASEVFIPLTVGGGIRTLDDIRKMLNAEPIRYPLTVPLFSVLNLCKKPATTSACSALWLPLMLSVLMTIGKFLPTVVVRLRALMSLSGRKRCKPLGVARSCSPAWMAMARKKATT